MGMLKEFRDFAVKGSAVDMAVGIIIGVAFGKIVTSLVNDVIMPPIGMLLGRVDFSSLAIGSTRRPSSGTARFSTTSWTFVIVAFCIFLVVRQMNRLMKPPPAAPAAKTCPQCLSTIPLKALRCAYCTSPVEE